MPERGRSLSRNPLTPGRGAPGSARHQARWRSRKGARTLALLGPPGGTDWKRGVRRVRSGSSRAVGAAESRRLADSGFGTRTWVPNLDGRRRLLWVRCSHVDIRPRSNVPAGVTFDTFLVEVSSPRSCHECSAGTANLRSTSTCDRNPPR